MFSHISVGDIRNNSSANLLPCLEASFWRSERHFSADNTIGEGWGEAGENSNVASRSFFNTSVSLLSSILTERTELQRQLMI
jgi:hypothetical protein